MVDSEAFRSFSIDDDILKERFPSVTERYYKRMFKTGIKLVEDDMCILVHTNKVCCVITVAPSHPLLRENRRVTKVDFQITNDTNRLENKVSGKSKKGGQWLHETSRLCTVTCEDGSVFTLYSGIGAKLVEVNQRLVEQPQLLTEKPDSDGFVAIVLVKLQDYQKTMDGLLTPVQYEQLLTTRQNRTEPESAAVKDGNEAGIDDGHG